jgi:hypothetical protein
MAKLLVIVLLILTPGYCMAEDWTVQGRTYQNVTVTKVEPDAVHIMYDGGVGSVNLADLTPDLQKRFNYNPQAAQLAV